MQFFAYAVPVNCLLVHRKLSIYELDQFEASDPFSLFSDIARQLVAVCPVCRACRSDGVAVRK